MHIYYFRREGRREGAGYHKNKGVHKERNNIHPDIRSAPTINDLKMS